jgi:chemotaxis protein MotB
MKVFKNIFVVITVLVGIQSCVSKKVYEDLDHKYQRLLNSNAELIENNEQLVAERNALLAEKKALQNDINKLQDRKTILDNEYVAAQEKLNKLQSSYAALESESAQELATKAAEIQELLKQLEQKENDLIAESKRLRTLEASLNEKAATIEELESLIMEKEIKMNQLKNAVSNVLSGFEGKGLTVTQKNGKVYVSMENKLLFDSGSWSVGTQGVAVVEQLSSVLKQNPDIEVLIEGHTDNVPYSGGVLLDNWDLSVKRATAIVRIMQRKGVDPVQVTAAGRSEFIPIDSNGNSEGRAKNRRIEIILTPNLDKINALLGQ